MFRRKKQYTNYLTLIPARNIQEFTIHEGKVTLLIPRFKNERFKKWFVPKQKSPHFKLRLDEVGSEVWKLIDEKHTVEEICISLKSFLEERKQPSARIEERVTMFLTSLYKNNFIKFNEA